MSSTVVVGVSNVGRISFERVTSLLEMEARLGKEMGKSGELLLAWKADGVQKRKQEAEIKDGGRNVSAAES